MQTILEFIKKNPISSIYLLSYVVAALTGLFLFKKYKDTIAKYFIYFLVYVVFESIIARYSHLVRKGPLEFLQGTLLEKNYWWFTIFWDIGAPLFFWWYYLNILKNDKSKTILKFSLIAFLVISVTSILITLPDLFTGSMNIVDISAALIILLCVFFYFMEVLQSDKVLTFYKSLTFYISCAILVFWLVKTPLTFFEQYYTKEDKDYVALRGNINLIVILFMYTTYTIGLIVSKPEYD